MDKAKDYDRFAKLMAMLALNASKRNTLERLEMYFEMLKQYSIEDVESAAAIHIRTGEIAVIPTVGQLCQIIEGRPGERALLAWRVAVDTRDYYYGADFSEDPLIAYCIEELCDTYIGFCEKTLEELKWLEKRFCDLYQLALRRPDLLAGRSPVMGGLFQMDNRSKGLLVHVPPVPKIAVKRRVREIEAPKTKVLE